MQWLHDVTTKIAAEFGLDEHTLRLSDAHATEILDLARIASHTSGDRRNAPLLCYVLGVAQAAGTSLADLAAAVRKATR